MTQSQALTILKTGVNVFLTGEPGSGKTYTINSYISYLRRHNVFPAVTASTGIAATHIGGLTIHSWSGIGINKELSSYDIQKILGRSKLTRRIHESRVLVIDEISMLDANTLSLVDTVCRKIKEIELPFGGMQIILVGDFFQLPPITKYNEERPEFAFEGHTWKEVDPVVCYITEQHRQEDGVFTDILSSLRNGTLEDYHKTHLETRLLINNNPQEETITKLFPHNTDVDRVNNIELSKIKNTPKTFNMESKGQKSYVEQLKRGCLSPEILTLKIGARVMFTKNSTDGRFVNGITGTVTDFSTEDNYPIVKTGNGRMLKAEPMDWSIESDGHILASITQIPLRLAWAITVHKSQGISLDSAYMDLSTAFEYGQGYVALSRVKTLSGLHLQGWNPKALEVHPDVHKIDIEFRKKSDETEAQLEYASEVDLTIEHENFILKCGGKITKNDLEEVPTKIKGTLAKRERIESTLKLLKEGNKMQKIVEMLTLTPQTIWRYINELYGEQKLTLDEVKDFTGIQDHEIEAIIEVFHTLGTEKLKPIHDHFDEYYSYDFIHVSLLFFKELTNKHQASENE